MSRFRTFCLTRVITNSSANSCVERKQTQRILKIIGEVRAALRIWRKKNSIVSGKSIRQSPHATMANKETDGSLRNQEIWLWSHSGVRQKPRRSRIFLLNCQLNLRQSMPLLRQRDQRKSLCPASQIVLQTYGTCKIIGSHSENYHCSRTRQNSLIVASTTA